MKAQLRSRGARLLSFFNHSAGWRVVGHLQAPTALPPGKKDGTHCTGGWVCPRVGLDMGKPALQHPNGCRSPDRPACSVVYPGTHSYVIATISWEVCDSSV